MAFALEIVGCVKDASIELEVWLPENPSLMQTLGQVRQTIESLGFVLPENQDHSAVRRADDKLVDGSDWLKVDQAFGFWYAWFDHTEELKLFVTLRYEPDQLRIRIVDYSNAYGRFSTGGKEIAERGLIEFQAMFGEESIRIVRRSK